MECLSDEHFIEEMNQAPTPASLVKLLKSAITINNKENVKWKNNCCLRKWCCHITNRSKQSVSVIERKNHNDINVEVIDLKSLDTHIKDSLAYIAITKVDKEYPIPVINGIAFLTGIGMESELQK